MPGGYNALVRAHEEMVDPLMNALSGSGQEGATPVAEYTQQTSAGPNNEALPNPWGAPAPAQTTPAASPAPTQNSLGEAPTLPTMGAQPNMPAAAGGPNPMASMMQQMMNNPAMMQPAMASPQGFNAFPFAPPPTVPAATAVPPAANANPFAPMMPGTLPEVGAPANPLAGMMQQMMNNPAMMQQSMLMAQQMFGGTHAGQPNMFGAPEFVPQAVQPDGGSPGATAQAAPDAVLRVQFASHLAQLSAMGFCNEAACLRALQQHHGRVDAAIDTLLANGDGAS